jgi:ABC-2 type transport system ATP-binding protein
MASDAPAPAVELKNVTKNYGRVQALKGINLRVDAGEVVAVLGPNGAGKSTTIALMLGMRRPTDGSVLLFGQSPRIASHRKRLGVMLQEPGAPDLLTVRELVRLFGRFHEYPLPTAEAIAKAGLTPQATTRLGRLSGGQKQRVYFALALVGDPDVLFLDEPTSGLDVEARRNFWDQINLQTEAGKTIILTTHNLEEADALAHRIVVINQGQIIADSTPEAIKSRVGGKYVRFRAPGWTLDQLRGLPGVQSVRELGGKVELYTIQPETVLGSLFRRGAELSDLEVVGAGLEQAFLELTDNGHHDA